MRAGPSKPYLRLLRGEINAKEYAAIVRRYVNMYFATRPPVAEDRAVQADTQKEKP